jgi:CheY-like chemotaxis protein
MIWMLILFLLWVFLEFITFSILSMSGKEDELNEYRCSSVTDEKDKVENLPCNLGNTTCIKTGAKHIQATTPIIIKKKGRILFVDDEEYLLDLVARMLKNLNYEVVARKSSLDALECIESEKTKFNLIIVDQVMPELSGTEFAKKAKNLQPGVPIILFTGFSDMIRQEEIMDLGIQEVVAKPINLSDLSQVINRVLNAARTEPPSIS